MESSANPIQPLTLDPIRIGLLQVCSSSLRDRFPDYDEQFRALFKPLAPNARWQIYDQRNMERPNHYNDVDFFVTTGCREAVYDDQLTYRDHFKGLVSDLLMAEKPLLAVCFGHQMVAYATGGRVEKSNKGWGIGIHSYELKTQHAWMNPAKSPLHMVVSHQDQVVEMPTQIPWQILAGSDFCPNAVCLFGSSCLGVQAHPEFSAAFSEALVRMRHSAGAFSDEVAAKALQSLKEKTPDGSLLATWMLRLAKVI